MDEQKILLIALGAAVILGGASFGNLTQPVSDLTHPIGEGAGSILEGVGEQGPLGWLIPDWIEDGISGWFA